MRSWRRSPGTRPRFRRRVPKRDDLPTRVNDLMRPRLSQRGLHKPGRTASAKRNGIAMSGAQKSGLHAKLIIIGSGPAGYTAAIYAARAMLEPVMISGFQPGGQLMITTDVENYPGFADPIQGPWLMEQMQKQAEHVGTTMISDHIVKTELSARPFRLHGDSGALYTCDALIIATGAQAKWLNIPSEEVFKGFG